MYLLLNSMVSNGTSVVRDGTSIVSNDTSVVSDAEVIRRNQVILAILG